MSKIQYLAATGHKSKKGWRKCLHKTSSCKIQRGLDEKSLHIRCSNIWSDLSTLFSRMLYNSTIFINYNFHSWGSMDPSTRFSWLPDSRGGGTQLQGDPITSGGVDVVFNAKFCRLVQRCGSPWRANGSTTTSDSTLYTLIHTLMFTFIKQAQVINRKKVLLCVRTWIRQNRFQLWAVNWSFCNYRSLYSESQCEHAK